MESLNCSSVLSPPVTALCYAVSALELLVHAVVLPLSALNFWVVLGTAVLHPNLKLVLLSQSVLLVSLFAASRSVNLCLKLVFAGGDLFWHGPVPVQATILFSLLFGNLVGHVLFLERTVATLLVKRYERIRRPWLSAGLIVALALFAAATTFVQTYVNGSAVKASTGSALNASLAVVLGVAECFFLALLHRHNSRVFLRWQVPIPPSAIQEHCLSERFQRTENIRTGRQLAPTFLLHCFNICAYASLTICDLSNLIREPCNRELVLLLVLAAMAVSNGLIELTIITSHPLLRRRALLVLCRIPFFSRRRHRIHAAAEHQMPSDGPVHAADGQTQVEEDAYLGTSFGDAVLFVRNGKRWRRKAIDSKKESAASAIVNANERITKEHFRILGEAWGCLIVMDDEEKVPKLLLAAEIEREL